MDFVRGLAGVFLCVAALQCGNAYAGNPTAFDELLSVADQSRSSDPEKFSALLKEMDARRSTASKLQLQKLGYLHAYEAVVYRQDVEEGIRQAKKLADEGFDPAIRFRAGALIANATAINRDFTTGLRYLEKALSMRGDVKDKDIRHDGIGSAAMIYNEMGQYALGLRYAEEILRDSPSSRAWCGASHARFASQLAIGKAISDDNEVKKIIARCTAGKELIGANLVRANLARKWAKSDRVFEAVTLLEGSLAEVEATRYPWLIAEFRSILADLKLSSGDAKAAEDHANQTVALGKQVSSSAAVVSAYHTLYKIASAREKSTAALELYKRYAESQMAHQSDVKARELAYEIVRHETQQKTKEIELLQAQQRLERENTQKAQLTTLFLAILLAGAVFWAFQVKRHQHQLKKLAQTDSLTGLGNRHFFTQKSERALVEAARAGEPASLVMFDLDHFKAINDTYGHGAGDWVLKQVGKTCASHCRKIDYLGRIGGEEFAVLLSGIDLAGAERLAENCRAQLAQIDTRECGYSFVVTASFGVSSTAQSGYDLSRLLSHADQMLYRAKNEGRNRVCAYTAEAAADHRSLRRTPSLSVVNR